MATGGSEETNAFEETKDATSKCHLEVGLHQHHRDCEKNPDHPTFIPVDGLRLEHLPLSCQERELLDLVRAMADITVRVSVKYVSKNRPETFPGSDRPYPLYTNRGSSKMSVGTGWIYEVEIFQNTKSEVCSNSKSKTCYCNDCRNSSKQYSDYAEIKIVTALHVVYDELEAANTTWDLFFDRGGTPLHCPGVVTLKGISVLEKDDVSDRVLMTYVTHDLGLAEMLNEKLTLCKRLMKIVSVKYPSM